MTTATPARPHRRLTLAAWLIAAGLLIEVISLIWSHPTAFVLFLAPGAVLVAAGVVLFLWQVVNIPVKVESGEPATDTGAD